MKLVVIFSSNSWQKKSASPKTIALKCGTTMIYFAYDLLMIHSFVAHNLIAPVPKIIPGKIEPFH